jgi:hypothetical protein
MKFSFSTPSTSRAFGGLCLPHSYPRQWEFTVRLKPQVACELKGLMFTFIETDGWKVPHYLMVSNGDIYWLFRNTVRTFSAWDSILFIFHH